MMYWYWTKKGIRPSVFYSMPRGELRLIQAFFELEMEEDVKRREMAAGGKFMPVIVM